MSDPVTLPEGQHTFKLNEVCKLASVQPYMLRFWGTEFPQLEAQKTGTGQRVYSRAQVELILEVRRLLFDEGLTVAGAKRRLNTADKAVKPSEGRRRPAVAPAEEKGLELLEESPAAAVLASAPPPAATVSTAVEVDNPAQERVQPLLTALRQVREELSQIVASLEAGN
jgi:DNA-binding transcriptional MerR regulator